MIIKGKYNFYGIFSAFFKNIKSNILIEIELSKTFSNLKLIFAKMFIL